MVGAGLSTCAILFNTVPLGRGLAIPLSVNGDVVLFRVLFNTVPLSEGLAIGALFCNVAPFAILFNIIRFCSILCSRSFLQ